MKKSFILLATLFLFSACMSSSPFLENVTVNQSTSLSNKAQLLNRLDTYFEASNQLNTPKILDMIYYKVFEVIPKDAMKKQLDAGLNNPMKPKVLSSEYDKNVEIKKYTNGEYASVLWSAKMEMITRTTDSKKEEFILSMLKTMMKGTEIKLDKKQHKFFMETKNKKIFAIKENGREWEFVDSKISKAYDILPEGVK